MMKEFIQEIAQKETKSFNVVEYGDGYLVDLTETFRKQYPEEINTYNQYFIDALLKESYRLNEAEYKGKDVKLGKPMRGDVKKYKVFVKNDKGNVVKVNFGDKNMEIKRDDPKRRKSFRARHKCDTAKDRTKPRYWSCKFWSSTPISKLLGETIEPNEVPVQGFAKKDHLCPKIWGDDMEMESAVRKALLKNAMAFIEFAKLENFKFADIILTGSLANYNWTESSDLDVHIVMDFSQIAENNEIVGEYLRNKKTLWNERLPIRVKGHDVELYVQDVNEPHASTGVYSIMHNEWTTKPIKEMIL
jgi:predicted nucleotidyltransferase